MSKPLDDIDSRVRLKAERGEFLAQLLSLTRGQSTDLHEDFIEQLSLLATSIREIFERNGLIQHFDTVPLDYWRHMAGKTVAFIDGGVARIDLPSAAPMGIRVGSYTVTIGDDSDARERFSTELSLVDELYSSDSWAFDDLFDDTQKMTDAARIIGEAAAALKLLRNDTSLAALLLHGPLINPVAPYGTPNFPSFSLDAARMLMGSPEKDLSDRERHFVVLYKSILEELAAISKPVLGVVERSISKHPTLLFAHLRELQARNVLSDDDAQTIRQELESYHLNDAAIMSVMLSTGEYCRPIAIDRQQPSNKWPQEWYAYIDAYPKALSTYVKCSEQTDPFRVEMHETMSKSDWALEIVYQTARLLPNYGFPVGLDIVDKFAKVPNWMSQNVRQEHAVALLRGALKSGNPKVIEFAKKVLTARGRDWLFRPKA